MSPAPADPDRNPVDAVAAALAGRDRAVVAVAGPVAVGKSTFAASLASGLGRSVTVVSLDAFLWPNDVLARRGLELRKGFPETYDLDTLGETVDRLRRGRAARVPVYSHRTYDRLPGPGVELTPGEVVVVEGLHALRFVTDRDLGVYLHADDAVVEGWFVQRVLALCREAERDPASFYARFADLDEPARVAFARQVWALVNAPNVSEHVAPTRSLADLVVHQDGAHRVVRLERRAG